MRMRKTLNKIKLSFPDLIKKHCLKVLLGCPLPIGIFLIAIQTQALAETKTEAKQIVNKSATAQAMVSAAHPLAAQAGIDILKAGGSAIDAAIAVQAMLGLVEPQSSGLAGGGFVLHYDAAQNALTSWDGRETAPAKIAPDVFARYAEKLTFESYMQAVTSAHSVGVPGIPDLLVTLHEEYGKLAWETLWQPAIEKAENGFAITPRLHALLARDAYLRQNPTARTLYYRADAQGKWQARPIGENLKNPAYAQTLKHFARHKRQSFYAPSAHTSPAAQILQALANTNSTMSAADLENYRATQRPNLCAPYRAYKVCSIGPPSSGGVTLLQILGMLEHFDIAALPPNSLEAVHLIAEASKLAFADRNYYLGDPDFVEIPVNALLDKTYLAKRAARISLARAITNPTYGQPQNTVTNWHSAPSLERSSTTHFVVQDFAGNFVSMTSSVESAFGSRIMAGGMMLNNQLTDFSFLPPQQNQHVANAVAGGKRPRSSMTPVIIFDENNTPIAALGSPGGPKIIGYVAQSVIAFIDWQLSLQAAFDLPKHVSPRGVLELEANTELADLAAPLQQMGHQVKVNRHHSGLHGISTHQNLNSLNTLNAPAADKTNKLFGGADKRREGVVLFLTQPPAETTLF